MAEYDARPTGDQEVAGLAPTESATFFQEIDYGIFSTIILCGMLIQEGQLVDIDHEIFSTVILSLLLIQEGQLSVSGERMCALLVNCLEN